MDSGFYIAFMESRAYAVTDLVEKADRRQTENKVYSGASSLPSSLFQRGGLVHFGDLFINLATPRDYAETAVRVIREGGGGWFLDRNNIDASNIFAFGERLGKQMEKVIEKAGVRNWN